MRFSSWSRQAMRTARALMVIPCSRSSSIESSIWSRISRSGTVPVVSSRRSDRVVLPWSTCAMTQKLRMRASSAIANQTRVRRPRSPSAGRTLDVAPLEHPEGDAAKDERVDREDDERMGLVGQRPARQATRAADPSRDVPHEKEIRDVLEPAEQVREKRDDELLGEVVAESDRHSGRGRSREYGDEGREREVRKGRAPRLPEREAGVG